MDSGVNMGEILGPIVLAVVINVSPSSFLVRLFRANTSVKKSILYGTCIVQWYNYYTSGYNDPLFTRYARPTRHCPRDSRHPAHLRSAHPGFSSSGV